MGSWHYGQCRRLEIQLMQKKRSLLMCMRGDIGVTRLTSIAHDETGNDGK